MKSICRGALALLVLACAATGAHAQRVADLRSSPWSEVGAPMLVANPGFLAQGAGPPATTGTLVLGGSLGALVGFVGGAFLGYHLERNGGWDCRCDDPGLAGLIYGAAVGTSFAVPTAVHLSNDRRGSYGRSLGVSLLVGLLGVAGLHAADGSEAGLIFLLGTPLAQVATSVAIEQRTSR
ncbi:MAG TPA: hypothetical protein VF263_12965 [Longimicrobiaceae bacterium]